MGTSYPGGFDNFVNPTAVDNLNTATKIHHDQHTDVNLAVRAIELELGLNPKGVKTSVRARLDDIDTAFTGLQTTAQKGVAGGYAGLDGGGQLAQNVDAGKMTSGTLLVARIPNISGAKVLGPSGGGAAIPLDAVPALAAANTTSGVFTIARIPVIPLATGVSGILPAAMIPSSVTSNANSQVVADAAARLAIPLISRVDGMLVTQRTPFSLWVWRADNSTWNQIGGAPGAPVQVEDTTDYLALSNTTFAAGTNLGTAFTAPASGSIFITVSVHMEGNLANNLCYSTYEIKTGASIGAGTAVNTVTTEEGVGVGSQGGVTRIRSSARNLHTGLTPGASYNVRENHIVTAGNYDIFSRKLLVEMVAQ